MLAWIGRRQELRWIEGRNFRGDWRWSLSAIYAAEVAALRSDVFFDDNAIVAPARQRRDTHPSISRVWHMICTSISDKLHEIVAAIDQRGSVNLTRLTVLKNGLGYRAASHHLRSLLQIRRLGGKQRPPRKQQSFIARRVLCWRTWMYFPLGFRVRQPQHCMHVFGHSKTSIGTYRGERYASFMITMCSWSNVGSTFIWGMEIADRRVSACRQLL